MAELPKFSRPLGNRGRGTRWWCQILDRKWKYGRFAHARWKICNITLIYGQIAEIFASIRKSGSWNTMVTSDFSPEVEIRPFHACAMHPAIITGTVRSLLTWLWGRYHVAQNAFLVIGTVQSLWTWIWGRYHVPQDVCLVIILKSNALSDAITNSCEAN